MELAGNNKTSHKITTNLPLLFVSSKHIDDVQWTKEFVQQLRDKGFKAVYSTTDFHSGYRELEKLIPEVRKIIIVLSKSSSDDNQFQDIICCIKSKIYDDNLVCEIVPVLLDGDVKMPFLLNCYIPFCVDVEDLSRLEESFFFSSEKQEVQYFIRTLLNLRMSVDRCRRLNSMLFTEKVSDQVNNVAAIVMEGWGLTLKGQCLRIDMNILQNVASYQRICLNDLYKAFFAHHSIKFFRISGVRQFSFRSLFSNTQVYNDLTSVYEGVYRAITNNNMLRYWYSYRRNGLTPADNAERAFKPLLDAQNQLHRNTPHSSKFSTYESRLKTLENFPIKSPAVHQLIAEAGFFSVNKLDYIQCYCCGHCLRVWNIKEQKQDFYFEKCAMVQKKREISNVIKSKEFRDKLVGMSFDDLWIRICTFMMMLDRQTKSYDIGHLTMFAQAGFYYLGTNEDVLCYDCCLGLTKINEFKDPWTVHYKLSPDCPHLRTFKEHQKHVVTNEEESNEYYLEYLELEIHTYTDA